MSRTPNEASQNQPELKILPHFTRHGEELLISTLVAGGLDGGLAQALIEMPAAAKGAVDHLRNELCGKHRLVPAAA